MGQMLETRRRMLTSRGRSMTITRAAGNASADFTGFARSYRPDEMSGGVQQSDMRVETLELPVPFAPPLRTDRVSMDGGRWTVMGAFPIYEGPTLIGYSLWVRGA